MEKYIPIFKVILLGAEFISALTAILYFKKVKNIAWKVFAFYLVFIFLQELYFYFNDSLFTLSKKHYFGFLGIPVQFVFFYWLFAYNSLKKKKLFFLFSFLYLITIPLEILLKTKSVVLSLSFTTAIVLLSFLLVMEFIKQIKSDEILNFKENKMFYVLVAVILAYIGTYPYFAFHRELYYNYKEIWNVYYICFISFYSIMYLLFAASFIWGERQS